MINDKKIEKVIEDYVRCSPIEDEYPGAEGNAFKAGTKWAVNEFINELWHPIDEEPNLVGEEIVLEVFVNSKHHTIVQNYMVGENPTFHPHYETIRWITNWNSLLNTRDGVVIKRWFYLKDLLTKTEEHCFASDRSDGKNVIFKEVKVQ